MTPEQFQEMVWGKPIVPTLPKFERKILVKYGKNIKCKTESEERRTERERKRIQRNKRRKVVHNTIFNRVHNWKVTERIKGVVTSLAVNPTHKGNKVVPSVLSYVLNNYEDIDIATFMCDYDYQERQARTYLHAIELVLASIDNIIDELLVKDTDNNLNNTLEKLLINQ